MMRIPCLLTLPLLALPASARPSLELAGRDRRLVEHETRSARAAHSSTFAVVDEAVLHWLALPPDPRNDAWLSRTLRAPHGKFHYLALMDALAGAGPGVDVPKPRRDTLDTVLVDALARLNDPRALPVLRAAFVSGRTEPVRAAAARGLGAQCADLKLLIDHSAAGDPLRPAAVSGLGSCLRPEGAETLAALLSSADAASAGPIASALGRLASARVWSAPIRRDDSAGERIRATAARALAKAIARLGSPELPRALAVVDHAETARFVDEARTAADQAGAARLDAALSRVARRRVP